jgi:hypothetical protein
LTAIVGVLLEQFDEAYHLEGWSSEDESEVGQVSQGAVKSPDFQSLAII